MDAERRVRDEWRSVAGPHHDHVVDALLARHREAHRRYHTARHVAAVLQHLRLLVEGRPSRTLVAAALFHDAVYDPASSTNELDSAELATVELTAAGWATDEVDAVRRLVLATASHIATTEDEACLLDADLAVLGAPHEVYARYVADVRHEYADVSDGDWRTGRAAVLRSFLARPSIFSTAAMRAEREAAARHNMRGELATLTGWTKLPG